MFNRSVKYLYYALITLIAVSLSCVALSRAEEKADESIFKYKKELSITDAQEKNLRDILSKLQNYLAESEEELNRYRAQLNKMIADKVDLNMIKAKLRTIARIQADATYEDIASVMAIGQELTAAQMSMWCGIQEELRNKSQQFQAGAPEQKGETQ